MMALFSRSLRNVTRAGVNMRVGSAVASYHKNVSLRFTCLFLNPWVCFGVAHVLPRLLWEFDLDTIADLSTVLGFSRFINFCSMLFKLPAFSLGFEEEVSVLKVVILNPEPKPTSCSWQYLGPSSYYIVSLLYLAKVMRNTARPNEILSSPKKC